MISTGPRSPVSFAVHVARLPEKGLPVSFAADEESRAALARDHDLEEVRAFSFDLLVTRWKKDGVKVTGKVTADIVQLCVVTLEPLENRVEAEIEALFVPEGSSLARPYDPSGEILVDAEGEDAPEPFPVIRWMSVRWPKSISNWPSIPIRASPMPGCPGTWSRNRKTSQTPLPGWPPSRMGASNEFRRGLKSACAHCADAQNRYFRRTCKTGPREAGS